MGGDVPATIIKSGFRQIKSLLPEGGEVLDEIGSNFLPNITLEL